MKDSDPLSKPDISFMQGDIPPDIAAPRPSEVQEKRLQEKREEWRNIIKCARLILENELISDEALEKLDTTAINNGIAEFAYTIDAVAVDEFERKYEGYSDDIEDEPYAAWDFGRDYDEDEEDE